MGSPKAEVSIVVVDAAKMVVMMSALTGNSSKNG